jgi:hypothetical protein
MCVTEQEPHQSQISILVHFNSQSALTQRKNHQSHESIATQL